MTFFLAMPEVISTEKTIILIAVALIPFGAVAGGHDSLVGDAGGDFKPTTPVLGVASPIAGGDDELHGELGNDRMYGDLVGNITVSAEQAFARGGDDHLDGGAVTT